MKKSGLLFSFILVLLILNPSCKNDLDFSKIKDIPWNPDFAIPLVKDSITFEETLIVSGTEKNFYIDESGDVSFLFYYKNDAFRKKPNDIIQLSPVTFYFQHEVTSAEQQILALSDLTIPPVSFNLTIPANDPEIRIDQLLVDKGEIFITFTNTFNNDGYLTVRLLNATKNGEPVSFTLGPFVNGILQKTVDISGFLFDLRESPNIVKMEVEGLLKKSDEPIAGDVIQSDFQVTISTIKWFEGFLGHQTFPPQEDTVRVTVFNNAYAQGEIFFVDPQVSITIINSIGIPAKITVEALNAMNSASGESLDIAGMLGENAVFTLPSPDIQATHPVIETKNYSNDNTGNSMNELFNVKPDHVSFKIKLAINPAGNSLNFFSDTSSFYADLLVKLPLFGHFDHLTFQDTFAFEVNQREEIERLEFRTNLVNGLPLQAMIQVYFTDKNFHIIDSLTATDKILIKEAPVDPSTFLPYPGMFGIKDTSFFLDRQRMMKLENATNILVRGVLNSYDEGSVNVKIRANQALKLEFSARVKLRTDVTIGK
ncbi:MAG: hypothetical protein HQ542_11255 [Bacteroidia bacterium]|nr:hypothetical protein [Bacteroidia bacterium]